MLSITTITILLTLTMIFLARCFYVINLLNLHLYNQKHMITNKIVVDSKLTLDLNKIINNYKKINNKCLFHNLNANSHKYNDKYVDEIIFKCYY